MAVFAERLIGFSDDFFCLEAIGLMISESLRKVSQPLRWVWALVVIFSLGWLLASSGASGEDENYHPKIMPASPDGERAVKGIRVPEGVKAELFAAEPLLANPVSFYIDEKGRFFVCETFRHSIAATDNRNHMYWLDDDIAARTVEDRVRMFRKHLSTEVYNSYSIDHDRIRLVEDKDGDGKADKATVFADGFNEVADGLGAGVLARKGEVYFTCIPKLWRLSDSNGDGKADKRQALHQGYGVHVAYLGHDLHGLRFGPDGKLYFSIGDRGLNITTPDGKKLDQNIDCGAVLRCDPDGSNLEIFATGMRNPQELAFNEYGDLFTGENNSDSGDQARFVHVVEGIDCGWRLGYQYLEFPMTRGPWNQEQLWEPHFEGQAAYITPPLANFTNGPSGLTYNPGVTLLPDRFKNKFFLCDFKGGPTISGVHSFGVTSSGASYKVVDLDHFVWNFQATDIDFGPDGAIYASDWVEGWQKTGKGRIFKFFDPGKVNDPKVKEVRDRLAQGFESATRDQLLGWFHHADQRIRQEAQFELASRGSEEIAGLAKAASTSGSTIARIHAVWALGQIGRHDVKAIDPLIGLIADQDAEVRAQACKTLGDLRCGTEACVAGLTKSLADSNPRVRMYAAIAVGRIQSPAKSAATALLAMIRNNKGKDTYLRHAGVMGLVGLNDEKTLELASQDESAAVRIVATVALRRLGNPKVANLLKDADPLVATEAARAIYDAPVESAMADLAAIEVDPKRPEAFVRRVIRANARLGQAANAQAIAKLTAKTFPLVVRREAVQALRDWVTPIGRDPIVGLWRPVAARPRQAAADALASRINEMLEPGSLYLKQEAIQAAGQLGLTTAADRLTALAVDGEEYASVRIEALKALDAIKAPRLSEAVEKAATDSNTKVRGAGLDLLARLEPVRAIPLLNQAMEQGPNTIRQNAIRALGGINRPQAEQILTQWLQKLVDGQAPPEIHLELVETAGASKSESLQKFKTQFDAKRDPKDPLASHREVLRGGNVERGRDIFNNRTEIACLRCHIVNNKGGEVGPRLDDVALKRDREYLLESLIVPNAKIAEGFETLVVVTTDGQVVTGIVKGDDGQAVQLLTAEDKLVVIPKKNIEEQKRGLSAMPDDVLKGMSKTDLRDLIEFLSQLRTQTR